MRTLLPLIALLAACKPPPPDLSGVTAELAALRQGLEEMKKLNHPRLDAVEAMDDLAREVKPLRQKAANPPPQPVVPALAAGGPALRTGDLAGGVGGVQVGISDLYWVLSRIQVNGEERTVLCLYRALPGDRGFQLDGVRLLNSDLQLIEYNSNKPSVKDIIYLLERTKK